MHRVERLKVGELVYHNKLTRYEASKIYNVNPYTIRDYLREYRDYYNLPPKNKRWVMVIYNVLNNKQKLISLGYEFKEDYCYKFIKKYRIEISLTTGEVKMFKPSLWDYLHRYKRVKLKSKYIKELEILNKDIINY